MGTPGKEVTKAEPCPICKKSDWCFLLDDGIAINCKRVGQAPDGWREIGKAKEGKIFRPIEQDWQKPARPKQQREWIYQDADGRDIIKVCRTDDGQGDKRIWQKSLVKGKTPGQLQSEARPYRYQECLQRARQGETVFWVEGENCADALWSVGIPATTTIGGSGAYHSEQYAKLFPKESVIICPDRDEPGLKYAAQVAKDYTDSQWLYAFPDSYLWTNVCGTNGADVADWIESGATAEEIRAAVEPRRELETSIILGDIGDFRDSKKITTTLTPEDLSKHLQRLISEEVAPSDIATEIPQLAKQVDWYTSDVRKLYDSLQQRQEHDDAIACSEISELVAIARQEINLHDFLPPAIARALHSKADSDRLDPIRPLQTFLACSASQLGSRLAIELKGNGHDAWVEYPILWMLDIDHPSSGKSQSDRAISAPLRNWQKAEDKKVKDALKRLPKLEKVWNRLSSDDQVKLKGSDQDPEALQEVIDQSRQFVFFKGTLESLQNGLSEQPAKAGMCWQPDEVSGIIRGVDAYKKSGDAENIILSSWNGPISEAIGRAAKKNTIFLEEQTLCISGGTQPSRVIELLDPDNDSSGMASRWLPAMPKLHDEFDTWSDLEVNCYEALEQIYRNLNTLNAHAEDTLIVKLSKGAKHIFIKHWEDCQRKYKVLREENPGLAYFLGKCKGHIGRLAVTLHAIDLACGIGQIDTVSDDCMRRASKLLNYYIGQFRLIQIHCGGGHDLDRRQLWAANLLEVKGQITAQQLMKLNNKKKGAKRITTADGRMILAKLAEVGLGRLTDKNTLEAIQATPKLEETSETIEPEKNEALPDLIKTDTPVEVTYPTGFTPPSEAPPAATRGTVTAINGDKVTIFIPPPPDTPDIPLGQRFTTVSRDWLRPLSVAAG